MEDAKTERHPLRFMFKFLLFIGAMTAITRLVASKKKEYYGLTESEARAKFESKLSPRIGEEKAAEVADQVIPRLKDKGMIRPDPVEDIVADAAEGMGDMPAGTADSAEEEIPKNSD